MAQALLTRQVSKNLARFIYDRVQAAIGALTRAVEVRLPEDESLSATYRRA